MGSLLHLALGPFEIDWGKKSFSRLYGDIFQPGDLKLVAGIDVDNEGEFHPTEHTGVSRSLRQILPRLDLLGFTLESARRDFDEIAEAFGVFGSGEIRTSFDDLAAALATLDLDQAAKDYHTDHDWDDFFSIELCDILKLPDHIRNDRVERRALGNFVESLHPYVILRLFAENPANLSRAVTWHFNESVEEGWISQDAITHAIGRVRQFLIVTEGSSDAHILSRAFELLRPEVADFFSFVDMQEGYPFTGTGNLHRFSQGLVAIGIENRVIVLYDNDLEGSLRFRDTSALKLPANMRVIRLPSLAQLTNFRTLGPFDHALADVNGRAAAIECYLDLDYGRGAHEAEPAVRWTTYNEEAKTYQGRLEFKERYAKRFLHLRARDSGYDFSKLESVLDYIIKTGVSMATANHGTG